MLEEEQERLDFLKERYELIFERIGEIRTEKRVPAPFLDYFQNVADLLLMVAELREYPGTGRDQITKPLRQKEEGRYQLETVSGEQEVGLCQQGEVTTDVNTRPGMLSLEPSGAWNARLYRDILPDNYERSYGNPTYAVRMLGDTYGRILSALYAMLREMITYVKEERFEEQVILAELFVQVYTCFTCEELPTYRELQQIIYWFCSDYSELFVERQVQKTAERGLRPEELQLHPEDGNACQSSVISGLASALISPMGVSEDTADAGAVINPQFVCDHCEDAAIVLDKRFLERRLGAGRVACEEYAKLAQEHNGGENAARSDFSTVPDVQELSVACRSCCVAERKQPEEQTAKEYSGSAAQDVQPQPAAYRFSRAQRSLLDKAKTEIAQITEQYQ